METKNDYKPKEIKKSKSHRLVRKSFNVPIGTFYDHTHYLIDNNTVEAILMTFIKWCETDNDETFKIDLEYLKNLYGCDYLKQVPFID